MTRSGILVVIDGWGYGEDNEYNAFWTSHTPVIDRLLKQFPFTLLGASGEHVGLPKGVVGNSEIGHLTIGAGRRIDYESTRVERAAQTGELTRHPLLRDRLARLRVDGRALHLIGLCSDGMVHSHLDHFEPLLEAAAKENVRDVFLHPLTDGRDVSDGTAERYIGLLEAMVHRVGLGRIATVSGRAYGMDRNGNWDLTRMIYEALNGNGIRAGSPAEALRAARERKRSDEWIEPTVIVDDRDRPVGQIRQGDLIIAVNFRGDRMQQLVRALAPFPFDGFDRPNHPNVEVITMTDYSLPFPLPVLFPKMAADGGLADWFHERGVRNARVAESEKYPHVTYYFNGKADKGYASEEYFHIPSPTDKDYRRMPDMSAHQVTDEAIRQIRRPEIPFILVNLCNADVVGHTGDPAAIRRAVQTVDHCLGRIINAAQETGRWVAVVGDHGNAEVIWDKHLNKAHVGHTTNPVPFLLVDPEFDGRLADGGSLSNVAPTVLDLMGLGRPDSMTDAGLIEPKRYRLGS